MEMAEEEEELSGEGGATRVTTPAGLERPLRLRDTAAAIFVYACEPPDDRGDAIGVTVSECIGDGCIDWLGDDFGVVLGDDLDFACFSADASMDRLLARGELCRPATLAIREIGGDECGDVRCGLDPCDKRGEGVCLGEPSLGV